MKVLIVGDEPSRLNDDPLVAFVGARCEPKLKEWIKYLGIEAVCVNRTHPVFGLIVAQNNNRKTPILALGEKASKALKDLKIQHFKLPHPSGRNRQINNKKFIEHKLLECSVWLMS